MLTTTIGGHIVPVRYQDRCGLYRFTGGRLADDAGLYAFWTAIFKCPVNGRWFMTARAKVGLSAGERFERFAAESACEQLSQTVREANGRLWETLGGGENVRYVRPATLTEVEQWMVSHELDADCAQELSEPR